MTVTSTAYLAKLVEDAISREKESPTITTKVMERAKRARAKIIAGLDVDDVAAGEREIGAGRSDRLLDVKNYERHRGYLNEELERAGVSPLAFLPKAAWNRICSEAGLYQLEPDSKGKILGNTKRLYESYVLHYEDNRSILDNGLFSTLCFLGSLAPITSICVIMGWGWWHGWVLGIFLGVISGIVAASVGDKVGSARAKANQLRIRNERKQIFDQLSHRDKVASLFGGGEIPPEDRMLIGITLAQPPIDVADILLTTRSFTLKVAIAPEAIGFKRSFIQMFLDDHARRCKLDSSQGQDQAVLPLRAGLGPIVYIERGEAVAILAQFGEFPIEQSVIDQVVNSEHLL